MRLRGLKGLKDWEMFESLYFYIFKPMRFQIFKLRSYVHNPGIRCKHETMWQDAKAMPKVFKLDTKFGF